jgi:heat shock protein HtpX
MAAYGLYTHIQANRRRSIMMIVGLFFLVYVLTYAGALTAEAFLDSDESIVWYIVTAWRDLIWAAPYVTVATLIWIVIAYYFHQKMIDAVTGGAPVTRQQQPRLYNLVENLCISRGIPMPKLKVADTKALNAFAAGMNEKQYSITVTSGLLDKLDDAELEAVLAHELTHIRNGDVRMMVIAVIIAGIISFVAELVFRSFNSPRIRSGGSSSGSSSSSSSSSKKGGGGAIGAILIAVALLALAWLLSIVIRYALSRSREFLADAGAVELTKNPDAMITALRKIEGRGELKGATSAVMELCFDNPRNEFADLFATHPAVDKRVQALVNFAGGHDPGPIDLPAPDDAAPASDEDDKRDDNDAPEAGPSAGPWRQTDQHGQPAPSPVDAIPTGGLPGVTGRGHVRYEVKRPQEPDNT